MCSIAPKDLQQSGVLQHNHGGQELGTLSYPILYILASAYTSQSNQRLV
jgi:hypothetical protein